MFSFTYEKVLYSSQDLILCICNFVQFFNNKKYYKNTNTK
jgi:hypothetical protein